MSKALRAIRRRQQLDQRKARNKAAFVAYREAERAAGREPMPKRDWLAKWGER